MIIADYHVHSEISSDSQTPMEAMVEQALKLGLKKLCFTEHMDYDYPVVTKDFLFDPEYYKNKFTSLKEQYADRIELLMGVELGLQPHLAKQMSSLLQQNDFDFVIGSSHVVDHLDPYYPQYWQTRTPEEGIRDYFASIIENVKQFQGFHVYGHLDYIIRYIPKEFGVLKDYSYADYAALLDEVLKTLIYYGKGIEINTAGLKYGLGYCHPKKEVLKRYLELGGELITIGSDAHRPEHLAYDFHLVPEYLKEIGFRYYATFRQGKPIFEAL